MNSIVKRAGGFHAVLAVLFLLSVSGLASGQRPAPPAGGRPPAGSAPARRPPDRPAVGLPPGGAHQHLDNRFSHNRYYFDRGYTVRRPPPGGIGGLHDHDGSRYWYHGGDWYRWRGGWYRWRGGSWVVWGAPIGLYVPVLPPYFTTIWWGGVPYYYANDTYYVWADSRQQYEVVAPPAGIESGGSTQAPVSDQLFVYPKSGQSSEQQAKDRYECHRWAMEQSGFDPTAAGGGVPAEVAMEKRNNYFRAEASCLEGRGYTVR